VDAERCAAVTAGTSSKSVSVILVTFNAWKMTKRCLRALLEESFTPGMEIILVDNGSSDDTVTKAKQEFPSITVLAAGGNFGFGRACNLGMTKAQGEFGVLLNNDALLSANQLLQLLDAYHRKKLNGIYTARIVDEEGNEEASCFHTIGPNKLLTTAFRRLDQATRESAYTLSQMQDEALEIDWCSGAFMLFPHYIWQECGGFDENFFMYYEDVDLCRRWRTEGYKCYVNTLINVQHTCGGSSKNPIERAKIVDRSQRYFYRKHYGASGAIKSRLFQILRSSMRCTLHGLLAMAPEQRRDCVLHFNLLKAAIASD